MLVVQVQALGEGGNTKMPQIETTEQFRASILDLGAGLGLLCSEELGNRIFYAMKRAEADITDAEELIHVTALALGELYMKDKTKPWMWDQWGDTRDYYHKNLCHECLGERMP